MKRNSGSKERFSCTYRFDELSSSSLFQDPTQILQHISETSSLLDNSQITNIFQQSLSKFTNIDLLIDELRLKFNSSQSSCNFKMTILLFICWLILTDTITTNLHSLLYSYFECLKDLIQSKSKRERENRFWLGWMFLKVIKYLYKNYRSDEIDELYLLLSQVYCLYSDNGDENLFGKEFVQFVHEQMKLQLKKREKFNEDLKEFHQKLMPNSTETIGKIETLLTAAFSPSFVKKDSNCKVFSLDNNLNEYSTVDIEIQTCLNESNTDPMLLQEIKQARKYLNKLKIAILAFESKHVSSIPLATRTELHNLISRIDKILFKSRIEQSNEEEELVLVPI